MVDYVTVLSLIVAALAVFVGPVIGWSIAKRQIDTSLQVANKQVVAPMRQAWINELRIRVSEIVGTIDWCFIIGHDLLAVETSGDGAGAINEEALQRLQRLMILTREIELMINPGEDDHSLLVRQLNEVVYTILSKGPDEKNVARLAEEIMPLCQSILKREWEVVKRGD